MLLNGSLLNPSRVQGRGRVLTNGWRGGWGLSDPSIRGGVSRVHPSVKAHSIDPFEEGVHERIEWMHSCKPAPSLHCELTPSRPVPSQWSDGAGFHEWMDSERRRARMYQRRRARMCQQCWILFRTPFAPCPRISRSRHLQPTSLKAPIPSPPTPYLLPIVYHLIDF
jgi:hypothetical protein